MGNILGGGLDSYVNTQVNVRQNALSKAFLDLGSTDILRAYNSRGTFLRLASSVNTGYSTRITNDIIIKLKEKFNLKGSFIDFNNSNIAEEAESLGSTETKNNALGNLISNIGYGSNTSGLKGKNLAANFILYGGAANDLDGITSGVAKPEEYFSNAYGWGGLEERGFVPPPGLVSADVKYYNNGALAVSTVNIKAYSRRQFALIDVLYLRPGYTVLLEFGHTTFITNSGGIGTLNNFFTTPLEKFLNPPSGYDQYDIFADIEKTRRQLDGNYDGYFGKISKFNWNLNNDGTYDIQISIVGLGSIIESLKIPANLTKKPKTGLLDFDLPTTTTTTTTTDSDTEEVETEEVETEEVSETITELSGEINDQFDPVVNEFSPVVNEFSLDNFEDDQFELMDFDPGIAIQAEGLAVRSDPIITFDEITGEVEGVLLIQTTDQFGESLIDEDGTYFGTQISNPLIANDDVADTYIPRAYDASTLSHQFKNLTVPGTDKKIAGSGLAFSGALQGSDFNRHIGKYMKLGYIFAILEFSYLLYSKKGSENVPFFKFDINYDDLTEDDNFIIKYPGTVSADPSSVLVPYTNFNTTDVAINPDTYVNSVIYGTGWDADYYVGRLMNVWVTVNIFNDVFRDVKLDAEGNFALLDMVNLIINKVTRALGSINKIEIFATTDGLIKFIEKIPKRFVQLDKKGLFSSTGNVSINAFGVKNSKGSFVRDIKVSSELSNKFATQIAIGAQAAGNANQSGNNGFTFANYNAGLTDRIIPERKTLFNLSNGSIEEELQGNNTSATLLPYYRNFKNILPPEERKEFLNRHSLFANLVLGEMIGSSQMAAPDFLPFNVSLTFDGLAGIKLFQGINIDPEIMPPSLTFGGARLLCMGVNHKIDNNGWVTNIDTLSSPAPVFGALITAVPYSYADADAAAIGSILISGGNTAATGESLYPDEVCIDGVSPNTVNDAYPRTTKFGGGPDTPVITITNAPTHTVRLASFTEYQDYESTIVTFVDLVPIIEKVIDKLAGTASNELKAKVLASAIAVTKSEQGINETQARGFNNNLTGVESSGFQVWQASDVLGKVQAREGNSGILKDYYAFASIEVGYVPLISKIIDRNMYPVKTNNGAEWGWRWYRDWNGYGFRVLPEYTGGRITDCDLIRDKKGTWNFAVGIVNANSKYVTS